MMFAGGERGTKLKKIVQKLKCSKLKGGEKEGDGFFSRYRSIRITVKDMERTFQCESNGAKS